jgi:hypothetical protein
MRLRTLLVLAAGVLVVAGCGSPPNDLFAVQRVGNVPGARLRVVISDGGTVRCDNGKPIMLSDTELLDARQLQRDLQTPAEHRLRLRAGHGSVMQYRVISGDGTVDFADDSPHKPPVLDRLAFYVHQLAQRRCGRPR